MKETTKQFLELFYNPGEEICISHNGYGYHSVNQTDLNGLIYQISPRPDRKPEYITDNEIVLASINPVKGFRRDENVTAYRGFLVEVDDGSLKDQMNYIKESGLPYSICVFSGNKSLHFGIVLDEDLPSYDVWHDVAEWILNILDKADQKTKNPTRSIRFPGNMRKNGKKKEQQLLEIKGRISAFELSKWLNKHPKQNPSEKRKKQIINHKPVINIKGIPKWTLEKLQNGIDESKGRNNEWFSIAMDLARAGFTDEEMIEYTEQYFTPDRDFGAREWRAIMKHAYKRAMRMS